MQHAVLLTVKAGDEALESAASSAEGECKAREGREYDRGREEEQNQCNNLIKVRQHTLKVTYTVLGPSHTNFW